MKLTYRAIKAVENIIKISSAESLPFYEDFISILDHLARGCGKDAIMAKTKLDMIAQLTLEDLKSIEETKK